MEIWREGPAHTQARDGKMRVRVCGSKVRGHRSHGHARTYTHARTHTGMRPQALKPYVCLSGHCQRSARGPRPPSCAPNFAPRLSLSLPTASLRHAHTHIHTRTHARTHARMHANRSISFAASQSAATARALNLRAWERSFTHHYLSMLPSIHPSSCLYIYMASG
jgi:hypothetical protein